MKQNAKRLIVHINKQDGGEGGTQILNSLCKCIFHNNVILFQQKPNKIQTTKQSLNSEFIMVSGELVATPRSR